MSKSRQVRRSFLISSYSATFTAPQKEAGMLATNTPKDAKCGTLDTGFVFLAGFVISKNRTAREHENESMGEYGRYHHSGVVKVPKRNAILCLFF